MSEIKRLELEEFNRILDESSEELDQIINGLASILGKMDIKAKSKGENWDDKRKKSHEIIVAESFKIYAYNILKKLKHSENIKYSDLTSISIILTDFIPDKIILSILAIKNEYFCQNRKNNNSMFSTNFFQQQTGWGENEPVTDNIEEEMIICKKPIITDYDEE